MLARSLPVAELNVGDSRISLSTKIASRICQAAIDRAKDFEREIPTAEDPVGMVEELHKDWDILRSIRSQLESKIKEFTAASDALAGNIVVGTSPLIELAVTTAASFETLKMLDYNYDLERVGEVANLLSEVSEKIQDDLTIFKSRQIKHDTAIKRCVLRALVVKHVHQDDLQQYDLPDDFDPPPRMSPREYMELQKAGTATKTLSQYNDDKLRSAASGYFREEGEALKRVQRARKAESRKQVRREILELWSK